MPNRGYTLIEVLIAVTVFAVLAAATYTALNGLSRAALEHRERAAELAELQLAVARLDADLRQLVQRPVRTADGRLEPAFVGEALSVTGTRTGWANPSGLRRGNLQRLSWEFRDGDLVRLSWPVTDRTGTSSPVAETVLADLRAVNIRYLEVGGSWLNQWPADEMSPALPAAVEVELDSPRFGRIRRLLVLDS